MHLLSVLKFDFAQKIINTGYLLGDRVERRWRDSRGGV